MRLSLWVLPWVCFSHFSAAAEPLTRERAVALARERHPAVAAAAARVEAARRAIDREAAVPYRPEMALSVGPRVGFDGTIRGDVSVAVERTFERGDKAEKRAAVARAELAQAEAQLAEARTRVGVEVAVLWSEWVAAHERAAVHRRTVELARSLTQTVAKQLAAGAATRIDEGNARLGEVRARTDLLAAEAGVGALRAELAAILGVPSDAPGDVDVPMLPPLETIAAQAVQRRGVVLAAMAGVRAAEARADRARAESTADLTFGGFAALEGEEVVGGVTLRFALGSPPRAERAAQVEAARAVARGADRDLAELDVRRELARAWALWDGHRRRLDALRTEAHPLVKSTADLLRMSIAAGRGTVVELLTLLRESQALELEQVQAAAAARDAAAFVLAAGGEL